MFHILRATAFDDFQGQEKKSIRTCIWECCQIHMEIQIQMHTEIQIQIHTEIQIQTHIEVQAHTITNILGQGKFQLGHLSGKAAHAVTKCTKSVVYLMLYFEETG